MTINTDDVKKIAKLARISLSDEETSKYQDELNNILAMAEKMSQIDTDHIHPMAHPLDIPQRLRTDEVSEQNEREQFQAVAPDVGDGFYLVPKVIEE